LDALKAPETWDAHFTPAQAAALRLADAITQGNGHISDEVWNAVAPHYDEGQLIELVAVIGLFNYFNRFNNALDIEVTRPGWPAKT
jgi:alkylhydroperoxidase family enzyme